MSETTNSNSTLKWLCIKCLLEREQYNRTIPCFICVQNCLFSRVGAKYHWSSSRFHWNCYVCESMSWPTKTRTGMCKTSLPVFAWTFWGSTSSEKISTYLNMFCCGRWTMDCDPSWFCSLIFSVWEWISFCIAWISFWHHTTVLQLWKDVEISGNGACREIIWNYTNMYKFMS